ncbi:hypothetical protein [Ottowia thiooxydans]|uniref:hypothetical protein n=1 Tax=Ottowia thiooxydans TaxID=219182 RepID=UPI000A0110E1|nr:hypothetical protein [Ottowia thiooxydans]
MLARTQRPSASRGQLAAMAVFTAALALLSSCDNSKGAAMENAQAKVERKAAERMAGARCVGAKASPAAKLAIARMLAVDTISPGGNLPAWLPTSFAAAAEGVSASDAWNALAAECPNAPTFGTPFGFPSAEIEAELRKEPEFAALSDQQWNQIKQFESAAQNSGR